MEFLLLSAIIPFIVRVYQNGVIPLVRWVILSAFNWCFYSNTFPLVLVSLTRKLISWQLRYLVTNEVCLTISRCVDIVSSSLRNQYALFVRLPKTCGFVLSAALLAVAGNVFCFVFFFFSYPFLSQEYYCLFFIPLLSFILVGLLKYWLFWFRYKEGHAIVHWKDTQHCYSLELETQRVWDYAGDNYVHRLIQSKTDGKLVELNSYCAHANDGCMSCGGLDAATSEALLNSRVELVISLSPCTRYCPWLSSRKICAN